MTPLNGNEQDDYKLHRVITRPLLMDEGNDTVGELIRILREHKVGEVEFHEGAITITEILTIKLEDGRKLVLRVGDYDQSAEIYIQSLP